MTLSVSVVLCTRNRVPYLRKSLASVATQTLPADCYEILVVDNASTDDTRGVVAGEFGHVPNVRYLHEPLLGLSRARNTGWQQARGEFVAFLDDDAIASRDWLERIVAVFQTATPTPGCVGGKIEPIWEAPRPKWLNDQVARVLTILDWSREPITINANQYLAGANMAFPKKLLAAAGGFDPGLGRQDGNLLSMEEILVQKRLEGLGYTNLYHPAVLVHHHIHASRLTKRWVWRRMYWGGISNAAYDLRRQPLSGWQRLARGMSRGWDLVSARNLRLLLTTTNNPRRFTDHCAAVRKVGYVAGVLGLYR